MKKTPVRHAELKKWVQKMAHLCRPDRIEWLDGSHTEKRRLEKEALQTGELLRLNPKKLPHSFYHRSDPNDVARVEHLTFICTPKKAQAGPTNHWMAPKKAYTKAKKYFHGCMKGRTMYVIPFTMGEPNSPFAKVGIQLTDSIYVALNMRIMTHMGKSALKKLGRKGTFTKCLHSTGDLDIRHRLILHFPQDNTIWSVGSGYGGNALLGKKCMALRIASALARKEGWMAEHMLIAGIEDPKGNRTYFAAAFPSACGKTNLAMLVPPKAFRKKGYKLFTIGDDIAWLRMGDDGYLYAVNPEAGMFGVAPGTNFKTNPNAMAAIQKNTIYTNVLLKKDRTVWWEGGQGTPPKGGIDWQGQPWKPGKSCGAHPNSRFTAPIDQCPSFSKKYFDPKGVRISAILFGGRHDHLAPLVFEAPNWTQGVYTAATMSSEITAAQMGHHGKVRRDPMAMLPFCGYNMADYFLHWLEMGKKLKNPPKIYHVNWFRKDKKGKFIWPGFGENFRVLQWILKRCTRKASAKGSPIGLVPKRKDIDLSGLNLSKKGWENLFDISIEDWKWDLKDRERFFKRFGKKLPAFIQQEQNALRRRLHLIK